MKGDQLFGDVGEIVRGNVSLGYGHQVLDNHVLPPVIARIGVRFVAARSSTSANGSASRRRPTRAS